MAAAEEERFTRTKHDSRFPAQAIAYCLREAGISMRELSYAGFYWQPWKGVLKRLWWLVRYFPASLQTFQGGKHWRGSAGTLLSHLASSIQAVAHGVSRPVPLRRPSHGTCRQRVPPVAVPVRRNSDHRSVRRGLHDALCPRLGQPHRADPPLVSARFARHLLRGAHTIPGIPGERRRVQSDGARVVRPSAAYRDLRRNGALRERPVEE